MNDAGQGTSWSPSYMKGKRPGLPKISRNKDEEIKYLKARITRLESRLRSR